MVNMLIEGDSEYEQASKLLIHLSQFTVSLFCLLNYSFVCKVFFIIHQMLIKVSFKNLV